MFLKAALSLFLQVSFLLTFNQAFLNKCCALALCFQYDVFQWCTWCLWDLILLAVLFIFFLIGSLISVSFSFWKSHTTAVDFLAFVTPVGMLNLNALLVCLSIEKFWTRSCILFNTKSGTAFLMVSLTSSPWNYNCTVKSFFSALCPSVILAWYSWASAIAIVFPFPIAPLMSLSVL